MSGLKKTVIVVLLVASMCTLLLPTFTAHAHAAASGYVHTTYFLANPVTMDGKWTANDEWADTEIVNFGSQTCILRSKWSAASDFSTIYQYILVEVLNDNTNDANDLLQFCFDGDASGGSTPQSGDIRIDITGHKNVTAYNGNGAGWTQVATPSQFTWANSTNSSPTSSTSHWIYEIYITDKPSFGISAVYWMRIAVYDASNAAAGTRAWPPTSRDVPSDWGDIEYDMNPIPEGIGLGVMVLLSSVAVVAGSFYFRKQRVGKLAKSPV
jgi:hypothetical protein